MKRFLCIVIAMLVLASVMASAVSAVNYTDLRPTYTQSSDFTHYVNYQNDDRLGNRANCYGFAMRIHYNGDLSNFTFGNTGQLPGEFADRQDSGVTYENLVENYNNSALAIAGKVQQDCAALGYSYTMLCSSSSTTYVPPAASSQPNKRLVALVGKNISHNVNEFHFLIQNKDGSWTNKMGNLNASTNCVRHDRIALTDDNISQHLRCANQVVSYDENHIDVEEMFGSTAIFFYIDVPGTTDMSHYFQKDESYQTLVRQYEGQGNSPNKFECAGNVMVSSEPLQGITTLSRTGYINHLGDIDYFIFDVAETGSYTIRILTGTAYDIRVRYADVTNVSADSSPSFGTTHVTSNTGQTSFTVSLTSGRRYCLHIYSVGQTVYEDNRYYVLNIT